MAREDNIMVSISPKFLSSFASIPKKKQAKVLKFITKFYRNPRSSAIHFEKIAKSKNPNLRSVRIDQKYRGIVKKPEKGNVYMLLWVDHHDRAYEWARKK